MLNYEQRTWFGQVADAADDKSNIQQQSIHMGNRHEENEDVIPPEGKYTIR